MPQVTQPGCGRAGVGTQDCGLPCIFFKLFFLMLSPPGRTPVPGPVPQTQPLLLCQPGPDLSPLCRGLALPPPPGPVWTRGCVSGRGRREALAFLSSKQGLC